MAIHTNNGYNKQPSCKYCGAPIEFIQTPAGKYLPVEPMLLRIAVHIKGNELFVTDSGEVVRGDALEAADVEGSGGIFEFELARRPHWANCQRSPQKVLAEAKAKVQEAKTKQQAEERRAKRAKRQELEQAQQMQIRFW